jgi:hypothetical protein
LNKTPKTVKEELFRWCYICAIGFISSQKISQEHSLYSWFWTLSHRYCKCSC